MELKTARLTVLIDPSTKDRFETTCRQIDLTPSQVVRRLIREFLDSQQPPAKAARRAPPRAK